MQLWVETFENVTERFGCVLIVLCDPLVGDTIKAKIVAVTGVQQPIQ